MVTMATNDLQNIVELYKFYSTSDWKVENVKTFKDNQKIVDMTVLLNGHTMNVTLVTGWNNGWLR